MPRLFSSARAKKLAFSASSESSGCLVLSGCLQPQVLEQTLLSLPQSLQLQPPLSRASRSVHLLCTPRPGQDIFPPSFHGLNRPCVSAVLQPDRMCWREALMVPQRLRVFSLPNHRWKLRGQARVSQVALMRKLSRACSRFQKSAQLIPRLATPLHIFQQSCCPCATAFTL